MDIHKKVKSPGSRGGHGYYDKQGTWVYGDRPLPTVERNSLLEARSFGVHAIRAGIIDHDSTDAGDRLRAYHVKHHQLDTYRRYTHSNDWDNFFHEAHQAALSYHRATRLGLETTNEGTVTSPELRAIPERIAARYGYICVDGSGWKTPVSDTEEENRKLLKERISSWELVEKNVEALHNAVPGLDTIVRQKKLRMEVRDVALQDGNPDDVTASYLPARTLYDNPLVQVSSKYHRSLWHEMAHFIDDFLGTKAGFHSEMPNTGLALLANELLHSPGHKAFIDEYHQWAMDNNMSQKDWEEYRTYLQEPAEMVARFFRAWVEYKTTGVLTNKDDEQWDTNALEMLGRRLEGVLRNKRLVKSFRQYYASIPRAKPFQRPRGRSDSAGEREHWA